MRSYFVLKFQVVYILHERIYCLLTGMQNSFVQALPEGRGALSKLDKPTTFSSQPKIGGCPKNHDVFVKEK